MPNAELLQRTCDYIAAHPEEWDQTMWARKTSCGTSFCFAGRAVVLAYPNAVFDFETEVISGDEFEDAYFVMLPGEAEERRVRDVAQELLGLNEGEADALFDGDNILADLAVTIENILFAASQRAVEAGA